MLLLLCRISIPDTPNEEFTTQYDFHSLIDKFRGKLKLFYLPPRDDQSINEIGVYV